VKIGSEAHVVKDSRAYVLRDQALAAFDFEDGGGGTGSWEGGATVDLQYMYLVRAKVGDMVGITINMCLECGGKNQKLLHDAQWVRVATPAKKSKPLNEVKGNGQPKPSA